MIDLFFIPVHCQVFDETTDKPVLQVDKAAVHDRLQKLFEQIRANHKIQVDVLSYKDGDKSCDVSVIALSGQPKLVGAARQWFYSVSSKQESALFQANAVHIFDLNFQMKASIKSHLSDIMRETQTEIMIRLVDFTTFAPPLIAIDGAGEVDVEIRGSFADIQNAKLKVLLFLDQLNGLHVKEFRAQKTLIPALCGRRSSAINNLMEKHLVNIYTPFLNISKSLSEEDCFHISGEQVRVEAAISELKAIASEKKSLRTKVFKYPTIKLQILLCEKPKVFHDIMRKHATFISIELSEEPMSPVTITGEQYACVEEACKDIAHHLGTIFRSSLQTSAGLVTELSRRNVSKAAFTRRLSQIAQKTHTIIAISGNVVDIYCDAGKAKDCIKMISDMEDIRLLKPVYQMSADMASFYKEFITGKKNGKIAKISKSTGTQVTLNESDVHLLSVVIQSPGLKETLDAFDQLLDELPAEKEFFIDDQFHKRIIGVGGKNIQSIMKVYGVFVKFMSASEFNQFGGQVHGDQNVLARTPAKNSSNLDELYHSVMDLVDPNDRGCISLHATVPRKYHRRVKVALKERLKGDQSSQVTFPAPESGDQKVHVRGLEKQIQSIFNVIRDLVRDSRQLIVISSPSVATFVKSIEYQEFTADLEKKMKLNVEAKKLSAGEMAFEVCGNQNTMKVIFGVMDELKKLLKQKQIDVYQAPEVADELSEITELLTESNSETTADVPTTQSASSFNVNKEKKNEIIIQDRFIGSAPNLRQISKTPEKEPKSKKKQAPIGNETAQKVGGKSGSPGQVMNSAVHQITNMTGSMSLMSNGSHGLASSITESSIERASQSHNAPKKSTPSTKDSPSMVLFGSSYTGPEFQLTIGSSAKEFKDVQDDHAPLLSPNEVDKFGRDSARLRINTLEVKSSESGGDLPSNQSFLSAIVHSILPLETDNKLGVLLNQLELSKYQQTFADHDVDFEMFLRLTEDDFKELGVKLGARKKLIAAIEEILAVRRSQQHDIRAIDTQTTISNGSGSSGQRWIDSQPPNFGGSFSLSLGRNFNSQARQHSPISPTPNGGLWNGAGVNMIYTGQGSPHAVMSKQVASETDPSFYAFNL